MNRSYLWLLMLVVTFISACNPCISRCELAGRCEAKTFEDYETTKLEWEDYIMQTPPADGDNDGIPEFPFLIAGTCDTNGLQFLYRGGGFTTETYYFDSVTNEFIALTTTTDVLGLFCQGRGYWPRLLDCRDAVITEVFQGQFFEVGGQVNLP